MDRNALSEMEQHAGGALEPGESYLAAIRVADPDNGRPIRDPVLGAVTLVVMTARNEQLMERVATISLPSTGGILSVTERRLIVFGLGFRLGPTDLLGAVDRSGLRFASEPFRASLVHRERIRIFHGDELYLDASVRASNPDLPTIRALIPLVDASPD